MSLFQGVLYEVFYCTLPSPHYYHIMYWGWHQFGVYLTSHARPLPAFQCCTLKSGRAWYQKLCDKCHCYVTLRGQRSPQKASDPRLHVHYSHSVCTCTFLKLKRIALLLLESIIALPFACCERECSETCWVTHAQFSPFDQSTTLHIVMSVTWLLMSVMWLLIPGPSTFQRATLKSWEWLGVRG